MAAAAAAAVAAPALRIEPAKVAPRLSRDGSAADQVAARRPSEAEARPAGSDLSVHLKTKQKH